jgi:hypothetical protein
VRNIPTLSQLQVTFFPADTQGFTFRFRVQAFNLGGRSSYSEIAFLSLATVPDMPVDVPVSDLSVTSDRVIKVTYANPAPGNEGSPILSYELQMDDGLAGPFTSLVGFSTYSLQTSFIATHGVVKGREHRFRYRALNMIGWGAFSAESYVLAATVPAAPPQPTFVSCINGVMTLQIPPSNDNGGTAIYKYELWVDAGNDYTSSFTKVELYTGTSQTYAITTIDGLVVGNFYRFKTRALNSVGPS